MDEGSVSQTTTEDEAPEEVWEGQQAMGDRLVAEAQGHSPVVVAPLDDRVLLYPVVPDEERSVDIHVVRLGGQDLPDMAVICGVGWRVNREAVEELRSLLKQPKLNRLDAAIKTAIEGADLLSVGDIVVFNKFSGMDVQGSNFVVCSRLDVLGKLFNFPVRLRRAQERWDAVQDARRAGVVEDAMPELVSAKGGPIKADARRK